MAFNIIDNLVRDYMRRFPNSNFSMFQNWVRQNYPAQYSFLKRGLDSVQKSFENAQQAQVQAAKKVQTIQKKAETAVKKTVSQAQKQATKVASNTQKTVQNVGKATQENIDKLYKSGEDMGTRLRKELAGRSGGNGGGNKKPPTGGGGSNAPKGPSGGGGSPKIPANTLKAAGGTGAKILKGAGRVAGPVLGGLSAIGSIGNMMNPDADTKSKLFDLGSIASTAGAVWGGPVGIAAGIPSVAMFSAASDRQRENNANAPVNPLALQDPSTTLKELTPEERRKIAANAGQTIQDLDAEIAANKEAQDFYGGINDRMDNFAAGNDSTSRPSTQVSYPVYDMNTGRQVGTTMSPTGGSDGNLPPVPSVGVGDLQPINPASMGSIRDENGQDGAVPQQTVVTKGNPTGAAAGFDAYKSNANYGITPQEVDLYNSLIGQGNYTPQSQYRQDLQQIYNAYQNDLRQDPRYQGEIIPATGYYIDPGVLATRAADDNYLRVVGGNPQGVRQLQDQARAMYEARMANAAGVPYDEYQAAMKDRLANSIKMRQAQAEAYLKQQANETSDMKEKLAIWQKIAQSRTDAQSALDKVNATSYGNYQVQDLRNQGDLANTNLKGRYDVITTGLTNQGKVNVANIEQAGANTRSTNDNLTKVLMQQNELNDPYRKVRAQSDFATGISFLNPNMQEGMINVMDPNAKKYLFGGDMNPEQVNKAFGFRQPQTQQAQQINPLEQMLIQKMNKYNIQGNEQ